MSEYPSYLIHYGIQGQKWGVRRFQNEDGTYTDEGLERRRKYEYGSERDNKKFYKDLSKLKSSKYNTGDGSFDYWKASDRASYHGKLTKNNVIKSAINDKKLYDSYDKFRKTEPKYNPPDWDEILWKHQKNINPLAWQIMTDEQREKILKIYKENKEKDPYTIASKEYAKERQKVANKICGEYSNKKLGDLTYNEHVNTIISFALSNKYEEINGEPDYKKEYYKRR